MSDFFKKQIDEIQKTPGLKLYGALLALTHFWTFLHWNRNDSFAHILAETASFTMCFPFFPNCQITRIFSADSVRLFLYFYLVLTIINVILFFFPKHLSKAYNLLVFLFFYKCFFYFQYYGFMGNYHYMANIILIAYMFLPRKKDVAKISIVVFYVAAGTLKINMEWLSGAAMIRVPMIVGDLLVASLFYVVFLEMFFAFGLLARRRWLRCFALLQFVGFHIFSWHIVGFFYPCMMASLLAIFFIDEYLEFKNQLKIPPLFDDILSGQLLKSTYIFLAVLIGMQVLPHLFTKDPALSGALRITSLNMFDASARCHHLITVQSKNQTLHLRKTQVTLGTRIQCDPIVFYAQLSELCEQNKADKQFDRLSFSLVSRRLTDVDHKPVLFLKDVCNTNALYWSEFIRWGNFK